MELMVVLAVFAALAFGMAAYASYSPVNAAVAQNSVASVPGTADFFAGWTGLLLKLALGFLLSALFTALVAGVLIPWVRAQWKDQQGKGWKSGPNARWGREEQAPKIDIEKMMQLAILSKLTGGAEGGPVVFQQPEQPQETQNQFLEGWW
jgi:hypothetical protein